MPKTWFFEFTFIRDGKLKKQIEMECFHHGCTAFIELAKPEHDRPGWFIFYTLIDNRANLTFKKKIATDFETKQTMSGWIYFLLSPSIRRVKIGYTHNKTARILQHQTSCPEPLILLGRIECATLKDEKDLHQQWAHLRRHLEWFEGTEELLNWIKERTTK